MSITRTIIVHGGPGGPFEAMAVRDPAIGEGGARPGILLVPNVCGTKEADFVKAEAVAALGYVVLVADVYGQGKRTERGAPDMARYMIPLTEDRSLLRDRLAASLDVLRGLDGVDAGALAAIGFCFGGLCVLDMARSGLGLAGGVSFHGVYTPAPYESATPMTTKLLVCHGWEDPICPPEATVALARELTAAGCDWQIHAYGHTGHAFTDPAADLPERGLAYKASADRRSWQAMTGFLAELFA